MGFGMMTGMYEAPGTMIFGLLAISVWTLIWKGFALWHSAKNKQKGWFIAVLILNTIGLLPIIYLIWFKPKCESCDEEENEVVKKKTIARKKPTKRVVRKKAVKKKVSKKAKKK